MTGYWRTIRCAGIVLFLFGIVLLPGCGKKVSTTRVSEGMKPGMEGRGNGPAALVSEPPVPRAEEPREADLKETYEKDIVKSPASVKPGMVNDIYFDFDRYVIREDGKRVLDENASTLKGKQFKKVVIEGHCDERGTTDYNLALGERRASAAKRYLTTLGVPAARISIISFGKEKPFCKEHNETCWQNNRRAHFIVTD